MPIFSGKTVNDAIENGLNQLGIDRNHADIKTIQEPRKGVLGAFARDAEVEIIELTDSDLKKRAQKKKIKMASIFGGGILFFILMLFLILNPSDTINPPMNSTDVKNEKVDVVKTQFEDAGFTEIKLQKVIGTKNNGKVNSVTINKQKTFSTKTKYKSDSQVVINYYKVKETVKSNKLTLKVNAEFTADEKGKVKISGITTPGADVRIGMGILGDSTTADKDGKFVLKYELLESSKDDDKITINVSTDDMKKSADVIIHQSPAIVAIINAEEAKKKAEETKQEQQTKLEEDYNKTHDAYEDTAVDHKIIYLIDYSANKIHRTIVQENGEYDKVGDTADFTGNLNTQLNFTFYFNDGGSYSMFAKYKYKDDTEYATFTSTTDGLSNELQSISAYSIKKYFE